MALINDFSNGNDMIVAVPGITSVAELANKKVGVEIGFVGHLLCSELWRKWTVGRRCGVDQCSNQRDANGVSEWGG